MMIPFYIGRAGTATSAMSEKVRNRLEELDDFEEVSPDPNSQPLTLDLELALPPFPGLSW